MTLPTITQLQFRSTAISNTADIEVKPDIKYDFSAGNIVLKDGVPEVVTGDNALLQYIEKVIRTEKYLFEIYREMRV